MARNTKPRTLADQLNDIRKECEWIAARAPKARAAEFGPDAKLDETLGRVRDLRDCYRKPRAS